MSSYSAKKSMSPFNQSAFELIDAGFQIVPIHPKGKRPGHYEFHRWRGLSEWQRFKTEPPKIDAWSLWPDAGIGIVLGSRIGADHVLVAVDIDAEDFEEYEEIRGALPHSHMAKRGRKGMTLFYKASPDLKTKQYKRAPGDVLCEILTGNATRQTVVPPSIHPDTQKPYEWIGSITPADQLPVLEAEAIGVLEQTLEGLGWNKDSREPGSIASYANGCRDDLNTLALANLDEWVPDLDLFNCVSARSGFEAVATWRESGTGRADSQRKRSLSIQPEGIKDFGSEETYSAIDLIMKVKGLDYGAARDWLSERIEAPGPDISPLVRKIEAMTFISPEAKAKAIQIAAEEVVDQATSLAWREPDPLEVGIGDSAFFPVDALGPIIAPAVQEVADLVKAPIAMVGASFLAAASAGAQAGHDIRYQGLRPLSLYILTLGKAGERKSACDRHATKGIIRYQNDQISMYRNELAEIERKKAAGQTLTAEEENITTPIIYQKKVTIEGLTASYARGQHSQCLFTDEGGTFVGGYSMKSENLSNTLSELSQRFEGAEIAQTRRGNEKNVEILHVLDTRLCVHLLGQPDIMRPLIISDVSRSQGFTGRLLMHYPKSMVGSRSEDVESFARDVLGTGSFTKQTPHADSFNERIYILLKEGPRRQKIGPDSGRVIRQLVQHGSGTEVALSGFSNEIEERQKNGGDLFEHSELVNKLPQIAVRIAGILTVIEGRTETTKDIAENAIEIARYFLAEGIRLTALPTESTELRNARKLVEFIRKKGGEVQRTELTKTGPKPTRQVGRLDEALALLVKYGWIQTGKKFGKITYLLNPLGANQ